MKVDKSALFRKMLITPRLNMTCDEAKLRLVYVKNDVGSGWLIENFNNDGKDNWFKDKMTKDIVDMIFEKYKEVNITWSRTF